MATINQAKSGPRRLACPVCGLEIDRARADSPNYVRCPSCRLVYSKVITPPVPSTEWDAMYYADDRVLDYYEKRRSGFQKMVSITSRLAERRGVWLDVGCGLGGMLHAAQEQGWGAVGIEPSQISVDAARERVPSAQVVQGRIEERLPEFADVDVVSFVDVLKYIDDPLDVLTNCRTVLADGGWIFIREANADRGRKQRSEQKLRLDPGCEFHLQKWSPASLERALKQCGFTNVRSLPSPIFVETTGWERDTGAGLRMKLEKAMRRIGWPAARLAHGLTAGRFYMTPNFISLAQKPAD